MLDLPWWVAPHPLQAGEVVTLGRTVDDSTRPPTARDVTYTVGEDVPGGTILGVGSDGRLYRLTAETARTPPRKATSSNRRRRPVQD